jgi:Domain of unknown function (DUF4411)
MLIIDASSMIYAWDNYPIEQFPRLWEWEQTQVESHELQIPGVAFDEVSYKIPDCCDWLNDHGCMVVPETNEILVTAMQIKALLGIENDDYHPKGVDENDLLIIATAKTMDVHLVSDERRQVKLPDIPKKRKIPAVCGHQEVNVACKSFLEYIKSSGAIF